MVLLVVSLTDRAHKIPTAAVSKIPRVHSFLRGVWPYLNGTKLAPTTRLP